jgi:signal transduction histidine kinase
MTGRPGAGEKEPAGTQDSFSRLVLLACHDLRTPLATVHGFAQTLARQGELEEPAGRYLEMINSASSQIADLVDELALGARIEAGRYDPVRKERDTLELAQAAAARLGEERVDVDGEGAEVEIDSDATERALAALARCALRHGGLEQVRLSARGAELELSPITAASAPVVLGTDLRDLGAATAVRLLSAQGGSVDLDGETLRIRPSGS